MLLENAMANQVPVVLAPAGNDCPTGYVKVVTEPGCRVAGGQLNSLSGFDTENDSSWPSGCYHCDNVRGCTNGVWLNYDSVGSANKGATPICAVPGWEDNLKIETLFIGDSDIEGWDTAPVFPNSINVGVGGYTCGNVNDIIDSSLQEFKPKWVVIVCGENDLAERHTVDATFTDFEVVIEKIIDFGARALYLGTKPEPSTSGLHSEYQNYDALIREYADTLAADNVVSSPPLVMVDVYPVFVELQKTDNLYKWDKLHLSSAGYFYWNTWTVKALGDTDLAKDCVRWMNNDCDSSTVISTTTTSTATTGATTTTANCVNDDTWTFTIRRKGKVRVKGCNWVERKPHKRCDLHALTREKCPGACNDAC